MPVFSTVLLARQMYGHRISWRWLFTSWRKRTLGSQECWRYYLIWCIVLRCVPEDHLCTNIDVTCHFAPNRPLKLHVSSYMVDLGAIIARSDLNFFIYPIGSTCALYQLVKYNTDLLYSQLGLKSRSCRTTAGAAASAAVDCRFAE
jgi:hypothetical protein